MKILQMIKSIFYKKIEQKDKSITEVAAISEERFEYKETLEYILGKARIDTKVKIVSYIKHDEILYQVDTKERFNEIPNELLSKQVVRYEIQNGYIVYEITI